VARFQKALAQLMRQDEGGGHPREDDRDRAVTVVSELRTRVSAEEFALVSPFATIFLRNARLLEGVMAPPELAVLALGACRFLCDRHLSPFVLRTFRPTLDEHGWESPHQVVEIATADQPALVNSICEVIEQQRGLAIEVLMSAAVMVDRDETGLAEKIQASGGASDECLVHLEIAGVTNPADLESVLRRHLSVLVQANRDHGPLRDELRSVMAQLLLGGEEDRETADFLTWLGDGRMNLIGFQQMAAMNAPGISRGLFADSPPEVVPPWDGSGEHAVASLKLRVSDPTRPGEFLDEIRVHPNPLPGEPIAYRIAGTYTAQAFRDSTSGIPWARRIWESVVSDGSVAPSPLEPQVAQRVFDQLPIDLVLGTETNAIGELLRVIHAADVQTAFRANVSPGRAGAGCWLTIAVPRKDYSRNEAERAAQLVRDRLAPILGSHVVNDELAVVRLHYALAIHAEDVRPESLEELTGQIRKLLSSWRDRPVIDGARPSAPPSPAVTNVVGDGITEPDEVSVAPAERGEHRIAIRVTSGREPGVLNQLTKILDHLGLYVVDHSTRQAADGKDAHQFAVEPAAVGAFDPANLSDTLASIRSGSVEDDVLGSLSLRIGVSARSIEILRAFCALSEFRGGADRETLHRALVDQSEAAAAFVHAFAVKFDPRSSLSGESQRKREFTASREKYEAISRQADDSGVRGALRELATLLDRSVRTSFFKGTRDRHGEPIALKLEHGDPDRSRFETFVYSVGFEGFLWRTALTARSTLHVADGITALRAGASKNLSRQFARASCVSTDPAIASFALRRRGAAEIDRVFESFLNALLDVMDDVVDGVVRREGAIVAYDDADPYFSLLVEERPTGFADLARKVVNDRSFWMGDAAVTRYDHRMAAEGVWSGLQAILPARPSDAAPRTAIAIGAPHEIHLPPGVRLIAAFDAEDVYVDPASNLKDVADALTRLVGQTRSGWSDLPISARGRGSAVFGRHARNVELSDEVKAMFGETRPVTTGEDVVRAILALEADLLWIRGPHIQVASATERSEVPSDLVEIDASSIGARVVGEAGYEVFSPKARIEFALAGGVLASAAADSLAADLIADRVSNVELALRRRGTGVDRVEFSHADLAADIRGAAMAASRRHALSMALDLRRSREDWRSFASCVRWMRGHSMARGFDRDLPSEAELERRQGMVPGLTRPEIATLHAAVRHHLRDALRFSALSQDPYLRPWIDDYFPALMSGPFAELIDAHPLRYEIAALGLIDRLVGTMGCSFVACAAENTGRPEIDIVKAWCAAFVCGGAREVLLDLDASGLTPGSPDDQMHRLDLERALHRATIRIADLQPSEVSLERMIDRFGAGVGEILRGWPELLPDAGRRVYDTEVELGTRAGLSSTGADHLARIRHLGDVVDICDLAVQINSSRSAVAAAFLALEPILRFSEIDVMIASLPRNDAQWGARAAVHLRTRLATARRNLTSEIVAGAGGRRDPVARYAEAHAGDLEGFLGLVGEARIHGDASMGAVEVLLATLENMNRRHRRTW